ncbi:RNA-guided endonuclease InsQ/TnpB family protein [Microseira sp. BLCC-F43]|uniref:RNA-guided endonuclease InsQ/TnpB family protein n=1 Tax=Microseira sp. BLCC-F43 TaxID=3153602 RepID=UPI0035B7EAF9
MLLGFKTELKINNSQRTHFVKHCGVARHAWNWGLFITKNILDYNKSNPDSQLKFPTAIDLHKLLVKLVKPECPWYYECSKSTPQQALMALRESWQHCFNKTAGVPKFKKKGKSDSFTLEGTVKILGSHLIQVPVIGVLKTYERLPQAQPKSVTISRIADRWFISFRHEVEGCETANTSIVGVELGIKNLATLSTVEVIAGAKSYRKYCQRLARIQYLKGHKVRGYRNWKKAQIKIARLHRQIANIRKDTLHKLTTILAKNHGIVVIEDLNVSGMMANHKLAASIADMGLFEFRRQLTYKCQLYGARLVVVDRWFPSSKLCSNCGAKKETLLLKERVFECHSCGHTQDRDLNAAINLQKTVS